MRRCREQLVAMPQILDQRVYCHGDVLIKTRKLKSRTDLEPVRDNNFIVFVYDRFLLFGEDACVKDSVCVCVCNARARRA